jgi:hypothetical protein
VNIKKVLPIRIIPKKSENLKLGFKYAFKKYNNNQAFYSQKSWGRLEMKPHEPNKKHVRNKSEKEGEKQRVIKKTK